MFITVPLDARVLDGTRPSAGVVLTTKSNIFLCYEVPLVTTEQLLLCSVGTQCKLHKDKVRNKSQMDGTELSVEAGTKWPLFSEDIFQHIFVNENV